MESYQSIKISALAEEDRPREKLLLKGKASLTDAELIAILIGSGTKSMSAVDLSRHILSSAGNNLADLARLSVMDLQKFKGIGEAKAISIVSALELGRRRKAMDAPKRPKITGSQDVYDLMRAELLDEQVECFYVILLNRANFVIRKEIVSKGGKSGTVADPKVIFKLGLEHGASAMILVHNHPSGNRKPSRADEILTKRMVDLGRDLELPVIDHLIFTDVSYFSFADEAMI
ncbi:DNA repair protein RadC [Echinicola sp. CAU 1574]|uniref:DNA repair protein RadC n=1 Tax=Echinicola arenosa TaxID=2774144 RepID=A0ABR9AQW1_9BACT|nr:DNA repair protein RadC [Echinicola arenosa]MBD8491173.1 DNA repair protein RadC [Echinicola arenosa]